MKRRVVITGMGAVTPIGNTVDAFWDGIKSEKVGIGPITKFDTSDYKVTLAAEVKDFVAKERLDFKSAKRMEVFSQYAVAAAKEAVEMADIHMEEEDPYRVGVIIGSGIGGLNSMEKEHEKILTKGPKRVNPLLIPMMISNMAAGNVAITFGCKGKCTNVVTACATGSHSIGDALRAIQCGDADVMFAGGTESSITPVAVAGFTNLTALTSADDPMQASLPFDKKRSGFVIGEGAGVVILEELEHAKKRGAKIYAEMVGEGMSADAYHITASHPEGLGARLVMENALADAGLKPEDIDYINVHGTSTHVGDISEAKAIKEVFGEAAYKLNISSTKSMTGHLLGAAGAVEAMATILAVKNDIVPPTINHEEGDNDEEIDYNLNFTFNKAQKREVRAAISNTFGFGGHNACVVFKKYAE